MKKTQFTELNFIKTVAYWKKKFKIKEEIYFLRNNRMMYQGKIDYNKFYNRLYYIYNFNYIEKDLDGLRSYIFHELGHIHYKSYTRPYITKTQKITEEYKAERFALRNIKKYCSKKEYKDTIKAWKKSISNENWRKKYLAHALAFDKIYK